MNFNCYFKRNNIGAECEMCQQLHLVRCYDCVATRSKAFNSSLIYKTILFRVNLILEINKYFTDLFVCYISLCKFYLYSSERNLAH